MEQEKQIKHYFTFNEDANGGEAVSLHTAIRVDEDGECFLEQELCLNSYGNMASIFVGNIFTPDNLRKLETELREAIVKAKLEAVKKQ